MIFRLKPGVFALPCFFGSKKAGRSKKSGAVELLVFAARHSQFVLQHRLKTLVPLGLIGKGKMWYLEDHPTGCNSSPQPWRS